MISKIRPAMVEIIGNYLRALLKIYEFGEIATNHQSKFEVFKTILEAVTILSGAPNKFAISFISVPH